MATVSVSGRISFDFTVDEDAVSEHDGAKVLKVIEERGVGNEFYTDRATLFGLLASLGYSLCVDGREIDMIDGWADFPRGAASGSPFSVEFEHEHVSIQRGA